MLCESALDTGAAAAPGHLQQMVRSPPKVSSPSAVDGVPTEQPPVTVDVYPLAVTFVSAPASGAAHAEPAKLAFLPVQFAFAKSVTPVAHGAGGLHVHVVQARVSDAVVPARRVIAKPAGHVCGPALEMHIVKPGALGRQRALAPQPAAAVVGAAHARPSVVLVLFVDAVGVQIAGPAGGVSLANPVLPPAPSGRSTGVATQTTPVLLLSVVETWPALQATSSPAVIAVVAPAQVAPLPPLPAHEHGHVTVAEPERILRSLDA